MKVNRKIKKIDTHNLWHPFTQMNLYRDTEAPIIVRGKKEILYDTKGNSYIDAISSLWVNIHGHSISFITSGIKKQLTELQHSTLLGSTNLKAIELTSKLLEIVPQKLSHVFYSDNGSTAVEVAIKMAYQYYYNKGEKRDIIIGLENAYHGDTLGAVSVGGIDLFHSIYRPLLFKTIKISSPYCYRCKYRKTYPECKLKCIEELKFIVNKYKKRIFAAIIEPYVQGAAGFIVYPEEYLKSFYWICKENNIHVIFDEVAVGFGRLGEMFACIKANLTPDFLCLAKGITAGYLPMAATLTTSEIFEAFLSDSHEEKTFFHGHSYTGNPLACSAAIKNIEYFQRFKVLEKLAPKITLMQKLSEPFKKIEWVGDIRQIGFICNFEIVKDKTTKQPFNKNLRVLWKIASKAISKGILLRPLGNNIYVIPPFCITKSNLERVFYTLYESIEEVCKKES